MWLERCRAKIIPLSSKIRQTSRPEMTRSLPNGNLQSRDQNLAVQLPLNLDRIGRFKEILERLDEIRACRLDRIPLARDVKFGTEGDLDRSLTPDDRSKLARLFHRCVPERKRTGQGLI